MGSNQNLRGWLLRELAHTLIAVVTHGHKSTCTYTKNILKICTSSQEPNEDGPTNRLFLSLTITASDGHVYASILLA